MTNFSQSNHQQLFVGKSGVAITGTDINTLADGEVACFTLGGTIYSEASADANDPFIIAMGRTGDTPLTSVPMRKDDVTRVSKKDYTAPTARLEYIGYTGVSGAIVANNNTAYRVSMDIKEDLETNHGGVYVKDMTYMSDASATQAEIAVGLVGSAIGNFSREAEKAITFKAINNVALAAAFDFDASMTVVNGSKVVVVGTSLAYNGGTLAVAGDFIRIGATATSAVALTSDVYKIVSVDSATQVTLDRPVQTASGVFVTGSSYNQVLTAATGVAADWGIALSGATMDFTLGKIGYKVSNWRTSIDADSFGTTPFVVSTIQTAGSGTYEQVAELERFCNGNNGEIFRMGEPNIYSYTKMAVSTETYDLLSIELTKGRTDSLVATNNPQVVTIAIPTGGTAGGWTLSTVTNATPDVIEDLLDGVPAYTTANSFDGSALTTGDLVTD